MPTPMMSEGSRSEVNCTRWKLSPSVAANACASVVLPTPGRSSIRRWPPASRQTNASRTSRRLPRTTVLTCAIARASESRSSVDRMAVDVSIMDISDSMTAARVPFARRGSVCLEIPGSTATRSRLSDRNVRERTFSGDRLLRQRESCASEEACERDQRQSDQCGRVDGFDALEQCDAERPRP